MTNTDSYTIKQNLSKVIKEGQFVSNKYKRRLNVNIDFSAGNLLGSLPKIVTLTPSFVSTIDVSTKFSKTFSLSDTIIENNDTKIKLNLFNTQIVNPKIPQSGKTNPPISITDALSTKDSLTNLDDDRGRVFDFDKNDKPISLKSKIKTRKSSHG